MENPAIVVITDGSDLNDQLFSIFTMCRDLMRKTQSMRSPRGPPFR